MMLLSYTMIDFHLFSIMGLLIYKYEPFWQEVSVKSLILRWLLRLVGLLLLLLCLFGVFRPIRECFTHMETPPLPAKVCKFDWYSALMTIERWGFFSVPHLLYQDTDHFWKPVTLASVVELLRNCIYLLFMNELGLLRGSVVERSPCKQTIGVTTPVATDLSR